MIEAIICYVLFPTSIITTGIMVWYVRKILSIVEEQSLEMNERFKSFHSFLEETHNMDLFFGEPRLKELLNITKDFQDWTEEFQNRIIVEKNDGTEED